jgi:RNA polymerase sigma-70 factor (ECF subfamily)
MTTEPDVTLWLQRMSEGDPDALDRVVRVLYDELRAVARNRLRNERDDHTLGATALVNEVYLKLARLNRINASDRVQFFAVAATTMRRVLVDYARARKREKRGGGEPTIPLDAVESFLTEKESEEVLALDRALDRLAQMKERAARVVELRFYAGLSVEETARILQVSEKTVQRDWIAARAWLRSEVAGEFE